MLKRLRLSDDKIIAHRYYQNYYELLLSYLPYVKRVFAKLYMPYIQAASSNRDYLNLNLPTVADILENSLYNTIVDNSTEIKTGMVQSPYTLTGVQYLAIDDFPIYLIDTNIAANPLRISDSTVSYDNNSTMMLLRKFPRDDYTFNTFPGIKSFLDCVIEFYDDTSNIRRYKIVAENKYNALGDKIDTLYQCTTTLLTDEFSPSIYTTRYLYNQNVDRILDTDTNQLLENALTIINNVDKDFKTGVRLFGYKNESIVLDAYVLTRLLDLSYNSYNFGSWPYIDQSTIDVLMSMASVEYANLANTIRDLNIDLDSITLSTYYIYPVKQHYRNFVGNRISFVESIIEPDLINLTSLSVLLNVDDHVSGADAITPNMKYWFKFIRSIYITKLLQ